MASPIESLRHPKERLYGRLSTIVGAIVWIILALVILVPLVLKQSFGPLVALLIYGGIFTFFYWLAAVFYRAYIYGHYVLIGPQQFPHLNDAVISAARKVGLSTPPTAFVYNSNGVMNAFARRLFRTEVVMLTSALIDADNDAQIQFVVGHEVGHHAAGHLKLWKNFLKLPGHLVPFLGAAYSRSRELTCDRIGAFCAGDVDAALTGLQMLASGSARLNSSMNPARFAEQEQLVPPIAGFLSKMVSPYPRTTFRVLAIGQWANSGEMTRAEGVMVAG